MVTTWNLEAKSTVFKNVCRRPVLSASSNKSMAMHSLKCRYFLSLAGRCAELMGSFNLEHVAHLWFKAKAIAASEPPVSLMALVRPRSMGVPDWYAIW